MTTFSIFRHLLSGQFHSIVSQLPLLFSIACAVSGKCALFSTIEISTEKKICVLKISRGIEKCTSYFNLEFTIFGLLNHLSFCSHSMCCVLCAPLANRKVSDWWKLSFNQKLLNDDHGIWSPKKHFYCPILFQVPKYR